MLASFFLAISAVLASTRVVHVACADVEGKFVALDREQRSARSKHVILFRFFAAILPPLSSPLPPQSIHCAPNEQAVYAFKVIKAIQNGESESAKISLKRMVMRDGTANMLTSLWSSLLRDLLPKNTFGLHSEAEKAVSAIEAGWRAADYKIGNAIIIINDGPSKSLYESIYVDGKRYQVAFVIAEQADSTDDPWVFCKLVDYVSGSVYIQDVDKQRVEKMGKEPNLLPPSLKPIVLAYVPEI